jgi:hypothetical protein
MLLRTYREDNMAEQKQDPELTTADIRRLLSEKYPPRDERDQVYIGILLTLAENVDTLEKAVVAVADKIDVLEKAGAAFGNMLAFVAKQSSVDISALLAAGGLTQTPAAAGAAAEQSVSNDKTPFPAGVATSAAPGTAQKVTVQADPAEDLTPNTSSGPAMNVAPIPSTPNGAKA